MIEGDLPRPVVDLSDLSDLALRQKNDKDHGYPFSIELVERFRRHFHFFMAAVVLCATFSPSTFAVAIVYMALLFKSLWLLSGFIRNPCMSYFFFLSYEGCVIFLFATACFYDGKT